MTPLSLGVCSATGMDHPSPAFLRDQVLTDYIYIYMQLLGSIQLKISLTEFPSQKYPSKKKNAFKKKKIRIFFFFFGFGL